MQRYRFHPIDFPGSDMQYVPVALLGKTGIISTCYALKWWGSWENLISVHISPPFPLQPAPCWHMATGNYNPKLLCPMCKPAPLGWLWGWDPIGERLERCLQHDTLGGGFTLSCRTDRSGPKTRLSLCLISVFYKVILCFSVRGDPWKTHRVSRDSNSSLFCEGFFPIETLKKGSCSFSHFLDVQSPHYSFQDEQIRVIRYLFWSECKVCCTFHLLWIEKGQFVASFP